MLQPDRSNKRSARVRLSALVVTGLVILGFAGSSIARKQSNFGQLQNAAPQDAPSVSNSATRHYATEFNWSATPSDDLEVAGAKSVHLSACPRGVAGTEPWYYVYIAGTGTSEAVKVTGGTCHGNNEAGTLQFTTQNQHPAGYTVSSASLGLQEASIAARYLYQNPPGRVPVAGTVIVPPGEFNKSLGKLEKASKFWRVANP